MCGVKVHVASDESSQVYAKGQYEDRRTETISDFPLGAGAN